MSSSAVGRKGGRDSSVSSRESGEERGETAARLRWSDTGAALHPPTHEDAQSARCTHPLQGKHDRYYLCFHPPSHPPTRRPPTQVRQHVVEPGGQRLGAGGGREAGGQRHTQRQLRGGGWGSKAGGVGGWTGGWMQPEPARQLSYLGATLPVCSAHQIPATPHVRVPLTSPPPPPALLACLIASSSCWFHHPRGRMGEASRFCRPGLSTTSCTPASLQGRRQGRQEARQGGRWLGGCQPADLRVGQTLFCCPPPGNQKKINKETQLPPTLAWPAPTRCSLDPPPPPPPRPCRCPPEGQRDAACRPRFPSCIHHQRDACARGGGGGSYQS